MGIKIHHYIFPLVVLKLHIQFLVSSLFRWWNVFIKDGAIWWCRMRRLKTAWRVKTGSNICSIFSKINPCTNDGRSYGWDVMMRYILSLRLTFESCSALFLRLFCCFSDTGIGIVPACWLEAPGLDMICVTCDDHAGFREKKMFEIHKKYANMQELYIFSKQGLHQQLFWTIRLPVYRKWSLVWCLVTSNYYFLVCLMRTDIL